MFNLHNFSNEEQTYLRARLAPLLENLLITGVNFFEEIIQLDACFPFSYVHHSEEHGQEMLARIAQRRRLRPIVETYRRRMKKALYFWDSEWEIQKGEKSQGIEFFALQYWEKIPDEVIQQVQKIGDAYQGSETIVALDGGYELHFRIDSLSQLLGLINLMRKHASHYLLDKTGNLVCGAEGRKRDNLQRFTESYRVPVIIFRDRYGIFQKPIPGFGKVVKISLQRGQEELTFYVDQFYSTLHESKEFREIHEAFRMDLSEEPVFANTLFLNHLNGNR